MWVSGVGSVESVLSAPDTVNRFFMRYINRFVLSIGVALSVIPFFNSVYAQQSSANSSIVLELQAMRQEIAELRGMIERQDYQLRKLQQAQQKAQPQTDQNLSGQPPQTYDPLNQPPGVEQPDSNAAFDAARIPGDPAYDVGVNPGPGDNSYQSYDPNPAQGQDRVSTTQPNDTNAPFEERAIDTPQASGQEYPPVIDRSIGSPNVATPAPQYGDPQSSNGAVQPNADQRWDVPSSTQPLDNRAPVNGAPSTGVIAVPNDIPLPGNATGNAPIDAGVVPQPQPSEPTQVAPNLSTAAPDNQVANVAVLSESEYYKQGFELVKQAKYDEAVNVFTQQISAYPQGDQADDAYYWIAESMIVNRNLPSAKKNLKIIIDQYTNSPRVPDAMLRMAHIEEEQGNVIEARILLQEILANHPSSNAAISAKNRLAKLTN